MQPLAPNSTIGILGGGQLARMMALAASNLGFRVHIYAPEKDSPAFDVTRYSTCAAYDDELQLAKFAAVVDVITYEFENIPLSTVEFLDALTPVHPKPSALKIAQDRILEKTFAQTQGLTPPKFAAINTANDFAPALSQVGLPAVLKTTRFGYDGKGQRKINVAEDLATAFAALNNVPCILEAFIPFEAEVSMIAARDMNGHVKCYDLVENIHEHHILARSIVPSQYAQALEKLAQKAAEDLLHGFNYVGIMAIEFFAVRGNNNALSLYFNEIAPRVHNSGHWTQTATLTCQFEQHMRAIAGWPLGDTTRFAAIEMHNILGATAQDSQKFAALPNTKLTLYGKTKAVEGRKMGHFTTLINK